MGLEDERDHPPSAGYLFGAKLLRIPLLGSIGCCAEIGNDEPEGAQECPIDHVAIRGGRYGESEINEAFACVVRTDEISKKSLVWQRILLEAGQVFVALVLVCPAVQVRGGSYDDGGRR